MAMASAPACAAYELLAKGRELAAFLRAMLCQHPAIRCGAGAGAGATPDDLQDLAEQILRCCDRALEALRGATEEAAAASSARKRSKPAPPPATSSKRMRVRGGERATQVENKWTTEDGFIWRKYGQKDIHGSRYPRFYFRCTYKDDHGCMARRQVQQSEADPSIFVITYFGDHTCCRDDGLAESPAPFVINFGASTRDGQQASGSPWPSYDGDGALVVSETSDLCHSPEEELRAGMGNLAELIEQSTPVPELTGMSSPEWDPLDGDGCLVWNVGFGESLFDGIGEFTPLDYVGLF